MPGLTQLQLVKNKAHCKTGLYKSQILHVLEARATTTHHSTTSTSLALPTFRHRMLDKDLPLQILGGLCPADEPRAGGLGRVLEAIHLCHLQVYLLLLVQALQDQVIFHSQAV